MPSLFVQVTRDFFLERLQEIVIAKTRMNRIVLAPKDVFENGVIIDDSGSQYREALLKELNNTEGGHPGWQTVIDEDNNVDWEFVDYLQDLTAVLPAQQLEGLLTFANAGNYCAEQRDLARAAAQTPRSAVNSRAMAAAGPSANGGNAASGSARKKQRKE